MTDQEPEYYPEIHNPVTIKLFGGPRDGLEYRIQKWRPWIEFRLMPPINMCKPDDKVPVITHFDCIRYKFRPGKHAEPLPFDYQE
jgi:hypothetical protein